jgi:hypothetical protein
LLGDLEGDGTSEGMTAEAVRALGLDLANVREKALGQILDPPGVRPFRARLRINQAEERLFRFAEVC